MIQAAFVRVAGVGELSPGDMKAVEVGEDQVLLTNVDGTIYACSNICTHAFVPLSEGELDGVQVECPSHGSVFDVTTGEALDAPADEDLQMYQVRIDGQDVLVGPAAA
tara:strand:- start:3178 stop:3501 length:324 start_codon:yes stop_codon:yes gene_type:complete